jgi:TM2 domain-containing membrane protein YozV
MAFCESCGASLKPEDQFCENCGAAVGPASIEPGPAQTAPAVPVATPVTSKDKKNPVLAAIASFLICGVGQMYNGHWKKGVLLLVVFIIIWLIFWPLALIVWIFGMYDAYTMAQKINNGENVPDLFSK